MTQPDGSSNPRDIPFQDQLNQAGGLIDSVLPGDHEPLGDAIAGAADNNPQDNNQASADQSGGPFSAITDAIKDSFAPLIGLGNLSDKAMALFLPTNIIRTVCAIAGAFFILFGITLLAREMKA